MSGLLVVFAKRPVPGALKKRQCPPLTPEAAADRYACMRDDVLEASARAAPPLGRARGLAVHPPQALEEMGRRAPAGTRLFAQRGADLGARMEAVVEEASAAGFAPVLLRGSDSPALGAGTLRRACDALERADGVLSPDPDGGYNLVGLWRPAPGLFAHAMSTDRVLHETLERARDRGRVFELLPPSFDVDTVDDLRHLATARRDGDAKVCPRTLAWLDAHDAWPTGTPDAAHGW
ncbi:MAG: TIGR04282 family arsenosugar biosynthesis glycosyltransferase [Myxococcota bacterium]|nr:TIGR04282 family arsenosugar biosynthesis glycosyltransferase [Myxococcota bacterium]